MFDKTCAEALAILQQQHKRHKCYAVLMIAAMAKAGNHIVVTRNLKHFEPLLPNSQLANWIIENLLLERISLAGIARAVGVSICWR